MTSFVNVTLAKKEAKSNSEKEMKKKVLNFLTFVQKVLDFAEKLNLSTFYIQVIQVNRSKYLNE